MLEEDSEWAPPSEAELKVINARRERSDKISKIMSEYLLKGYKMLATTCPKCMSIELKTREGEIYCVACSEVDCEETSKDNPLLNRQAAESQLRENAVAKSKNPAPPRCPQNLKIVNSLILRRRFHSRRPETSDNGFKIKVCQASTGRNSTF